MSQPTNKLSKFWLELKRRKVIRRNIAYLASSFVILELVSIIAEPFGLPDWTLKLVFVLLCIGFVISIILSWYYDFTSEGLERIKSVNEVQEVPPEKPSTLNAWKIATYISIIIIAGLLVLNILKGGKSSKDITDLEKSIAVIPFIDDSPNKDNEHIINGIMEDLLINLQSIKDLRVPGRTSIEQYRNNPKPIPDIATELGVNYIVEGSGQKYGNHYTLRVQLLEGATGMHIWGDKFEQDIVSMEDIVNFISEISSSIADKLEAIITPEEKQLIEKVPTTSLTAYDFYQRGNEEQIKYRLDRDNKDALVRAEDLYNKALEYDPTFALAYTGLAWVYWLKYYQETYLSENFLDSTLILADIALSYDNQLSAAYVIKGAYYQQHNKIEQAILEYDRAVQYNRNEWMAYYGKANLYSHEDDNKNSIENYYKAASLYRGPFLPGIYKRMAMRFSWVDFREIFEKYAKDALTLDDDSASYYGFLAMSESDNGNFKKGIEFFERSIAIDSTNWNNYFLIGRNHYFLGQFEEALVYYKKSLEMWQGQEDLPEHFSAGIMMRLGQTYLSIGKQEEATYYLNRAREFFNELDELERSAWLSENSVIFARAGLYACLGDKNKAFEYLRLYNQKRHFPVWIVIQLKVDPQFDNIRDEPEFQQIVKDVEAKYQAEHERVRKWVEENDML